MLLKPLVQGASIKAYKATHFDKRNPTLVHHFIQGILRNAEDVGHLVDIQQMRSERRRRVNFFHVTTL